jgi:3-keto-5-aminohexanoate cleavage enzyme
MGVTTSAEIEPDPERRLELVRAWRAPDIRLRQPLRNRRDRGHGGPHLGRGRHRGGRLDRGGRRAARGVRTWRVTRILVEPGELRLLDSEDKAADALGLLEEIHRAPDNFGLTSPRLQHGDGEVAWVLLVDAVRRGLDTRIGLEDALYGPDGERTRGNEALVRAARELGAGTD